MNEAERMEWIRNANDAQRRAVLSIIAAWWPELFDDTVHVTDILKGIGK